MPNPDETDLRALQDERAIRRLIATYGDAVAHLDAGRAASTYVEDGCVSVAGAVTIGRADIEAGMRNTFAAFDMLQIVAHSGLIDVAGDMATARWSTIEIGCRKGTTALTCILGRYEDAMIRTVDGWRFRSRIFTLAGRALVETGKLQINDAFGSLAFVAGSAGI